MGSFNEACALSGFSVTPNTPVRVVFLTQNPYVVSDGHEAKRGVHHNEQWFVRTPPFKAKYDDYGRVRFDDTPITDLIVKCFHDDAVERPFGFNEYHDPPVNPNNKDIHHFLEAAYEGRLRVRNGSFSVARMGREKTPENFPTWQGIRDLLREKFHIKEGKEEGYNAQEVAPGLVCVHYLGQNDKSRLTKARALLEEKYDVNQREDRLEGGHFLMVAPKGVYSGDILLHDHEKTLKLLNSTPKSNLNPDLSVMSVVIREDVWKLYRDLKQSRHMRYEDLIGQINKMVEAVKGSSSFSLFMSGVEQYVPGQVTPMAHLSRCLEDDVNFPAVNDLIETIAEMSLIETAMYAMHQSWHIRQLGSQEEGWGIRIEFLGAMQKLSRSLDRGSRGN